MKSTLIAALVLGSAVAGAGVADAATAKCRDSKGDYVACDARGAKPAAAMAGQSSAVPMPRDSNRSPDRIRSSAPHCKAGKVCGGGCIPLDRVCHK
jgi:hypothetical protein